MSSGKEIRDLNKIYLEAVYGQSAGQKLAKREKDDDAAGAPNPKKKARFKVTDYDLKHTEAGEFTEVVKKIVFQGKPYNEENIFHMKRELGDICWYLAQAFMALDTDFNEILEMNVSKLESRYPGGTFDVHKSENRKEGDL